MQGIITFHLYDNMHFIFTQQFLFFLFFLGRTAEQKGKKERGLGKGIFALLRIKLERFRFSLIKKKPKQKIFQILLKEKIAPPQAEKKKGGGKNRAAGAEKRNCRRFRNSASSRKPKQKNFLSLK